LPDGAQAGPGRLDARLSEQGWMLVGTAVH